MSTSSHRQQHLRLTPCPFPPADPCSLTPPSITTVGTGVTFTLLSCPRSRAASQRVCTGHFAHLATYTSQQVRRGSGPALPVLPRCQSLRSGQQHWHPEPP